MRRERGGSVSPAMFDHVTIRVGDRAASERFYDIEVVNHHWEG